MDWIRVEGASMAPFLSPGDWVGVHWVRGQEPVRPVLGELVIGLSNAGDARELIVHRVIRTRPFQTKGDAAFAFDAFGEAQTWGRVTGVRRAASVTGGTFLRTNGLDRWIARLSRFGVPPATWRARFARRAIYALAWLRRKSL